MKDAYKDIITIEPGKRSGQPVIRGMRITVGDVLALLAAGMSEKEIISDFPELTTRDIQAALAYASEKGLATPQGLLRHYTAVFKKSGTWIVAWVEEVPGVNTQGRTMKEARANLRDALALMLEYNQVEAGQKKRNVKRESLRMELLSVAA